MIWVIVSAYMLALRQSVRETPQFDKIIAKARGFVKVC